MRISKIITAFLVFAFLSPIASLLYGQTTAKDRLVNDVINPLQILAGVRDSIRLDDLFVSDSYHVDALPSPHLTAIVDTATKTLFMTAHPSFGGLTLLRLKHPAQEIAVPVLVTKPHFHTFRLKWDRPLNVVTVFGGFNGWNRQSHPLVRSQDLDTYELTVRLESGRHQYRFWIDGEEINDPANPDSVPNGFGAFNSELLKTDFALDADALLPLKKRETGSEFIFTFRFYDPKIRRALTGSDIIALLDNRVLSSSAITIKGKEITLRLQKKNLVNTRVVRLAVSADGLATPFHTIRFKDGFHAGSAEFQKRGLFTWHDGVMYSLMIDRFKDGDPTLNNPVKHDSLLPPTNYQGGDFAGIRQKLEEGYFDSLGISILWLSPVYDNPQVAHREYPPPYRFFSGYHGYWPVASDRTEEQFGTLDDLREIVSSARSRNIRVLLDFVANHVHQDHPLAQKKRNWFGSYELPDGRKNFRLWDEHRLTTWFEPFLPKFDFLSSDQPARWMGENARWWLENTDADGFRHDAVKHIPHEVWRVITSALKLSLPARKDLYQIGETFATHTLINSYVKNGMMDAQFNFNLYDIALPTFLLPEMTFDGLNLELLRSHAVYGANHLMGNIIDNHDKIRFIAYADGDVRHNQPDAAEIGWTNPPQVDSPLAYEKTKLYLSFILTIPGIPQLFYGNEIGLTGAVDPDNRRMMRFGDELTLWEKEMFADVRKLISIRNNSSALRYGNLIPLHVGKQTYAFLRADFNQRVLVILNKGQHAEVVECKVPESFGITGGVDLVRGDSHRASTNTLNILTEGMSYRIIELK